MENDDHQKGMIYTRRHVLALFGSAGVTLLAACSGLSSGESSTAPVETLQPTGTSAAGKATPNTGSTGIPVPNTGNIGVCVVKPEMTEGPYFVDEELNRSDIRVEPSDSSVVEGVKLVLTFNVSQMANNACSPLSGAKVDVWHCDALGRYSDEVDQGAGFNTKGLKFLRGYQLTDENGVAQFTTIYPGWYPGRTVHIHFKIRTQATNGQNYEFTSQLFFDDALSDTVFEREPYASKGKRDQTNATDGIYQNGGDQMLLAPVETTDGYEATFNLALDLSDTQVGQSDAQGAGGPDGPGGGRRTP